MKTILESIPGCYGNNIEKREVCPNKSQFAVVMVNGVTLYTCDEHLAPCVFTRSGCKVFAIQQQFYFDDGVPEVKAASDR